MNRRPLWPWERRTRGRFIVEAREHLTPDIADHLTRVMVEFINGERQVIVVDPDLHIREVFA